MTMQCYFISGSPPCWTVMLALGHKGLDYDAKRLDNAKREQKSSEFLAVNPRGSVPVLTDGAVTVRETNAILAYLDAACPSPPLFGETPAEAAAIWQIVEETGSRLRDPVGSAARPVFRGRGAESVDAVAAEAAKAHGEFALYDAMLNGRPFLAGEAISAADFAVYPALAQFRRAAMRAAGDAAVSAALGIEPLAEIYPALAAWAARIEAMPGYDAAYPPHWR